MIGAFDFERVLTSIRNVFFAGFKVETGCRGGHDVVVLVCEGGGGGGDHHGLGHHGVGGGRAGHHHVPRHGLTHARGQVPHSRHARALT